MVTSYKDLIVWQKSIVLAKHIYQLTAAFPKSEIYGIISQMRRAAVSIPSNIAEGFVRNSPREFVQFLTIAFRSGAELETQIILAKSLKLAPEKEFAEPEEILEEIMKMLNTLLKKLHSRTYTTNR